MPFVFKSLALLLSISAAFAADKETPFKAAPAASYASHQSNAQITIGVDPYVTGDKVQARLRQSSTPINSASSPCWS